MSLLSALGTPLRELRACELEPVTVAVVDSGVDATHPELAGRVVRAFRIKEAHGKYEVAEGDVPRNADLYGHGTAVTSVITRIAPNARILDVRVLDAENIGTGAALVAGLRHAVDAQARVVNLSLAARARFAPALNALCERAYRQNQVVVAARRNMPLADDDGFPAEFSSCIGVDSGRFASQFELLFQGDHAIEFVAHGEQVVVAAPGGGSTAMTGTSMAAPAVSGLAALLAGAYPDLRPFDVKSLLRHFAG